MYFTPVSSMNEIAMPDYAEISHVLGKTTLKLHPSQVHGLMCGLLCGDPRKTPAWEELVTGDKKSAKTDSLLKDLYAHSANKLGEFSFDFQLLLPDETDPLPERAEALTLWAQGFLTGLKLAHIKVVDREAGEVTEAIGDMIEIAKMNFEDVESSEEDEAAYVELVEYVRMAAILIGKSI